MILTFELEPELEQSLENDAKQKPLSSGGFGFLKF